MKIRTGFGYDVHAFAEGRALWLGGVRIDYPLGLAGHSDADVLIHAICDALLGAAALRDIGYHFPDTSSEYEGMDSRILLARTVALLRGAGYEPGNVDATVIAEQPRLSPYIPLMQQTLAQTMQVDPADISVKATTTEKLGFTGRREGIAACAAVLIHSIA
jgi:2-C-methyl-D-erythritol 2,4-cyclodiphosphate synthase